MSQAGITVEADSLLKLATVADSPIMDVAGTYDEKGETGRDLRSITIKQVSAL